MATINSISADVYTLTNREDLVPETKVAIRKAIFKFHSADTFKRDLRTTRLTMSTYPLVTPDQFRWEIQLSEFPNFRRPKVLRYPLELRLWHDNDFEELSAENLFDSYKAEVKRYFFVAGSILSIRADVSPDYLDFTYYAYPAVPPDSDATIQSWICDQYVDSIVEEAAGTVFKMIGKDDEYARYQTLFAENLAILRATDVGEGV